MRQLVSRSFRQLAPAVAVGCAVLLAAGCSAQASPTTAQLLASAAAGLRGGQPCAIRGDIAVGTADGSYDVVNSVSAGDQFSATITRRFKLGDKQLTQRDNFIDDGAALYFRSADELRLVYAGKVPARLGGRWVRFPSWQALSEQAYNAASSRLSQYPGPGGQALFTLMDDSRTVPSAGGSCGLLLAQLRSAQPGQDSRPEPGKLGGQPTLSFTVGSLFSSLSSQAYRITVSRRKPVRVLRVTSGKYVLALSYPATIPPVSAPPAGQVIAAAEVPGLSAGHH